MLVAGAETKCVYLSIFEIVCLLFESANVEVTRGLVACRLNSNI